MVPPHRNQIYGSAKDPGRRDTSITSVSADSHLAPGAVPALSASW